MVTLLILLYPKTLGAPFIVVICCMQAVDRMKQIDQAVDIGVPTGVLGTELLYISNRAYVTKIYALRKCY